MTTENSRREFLKRSGALSLAGVASPLVFNLVAMGEAAAANATDYKALVCVFLYGGNDWANTIVSYDDDYYQKYFNERRSIAYDQGLLKNTLLTPKTPLPGGHQYAFAPELAPLIPHFNAEKLAVILNIGALIEPTTKAAYQNKSVDIPPKLFSHNDQQSFYQSSGGEGSGSGWGGRLGGALASTNPNRTFTCISVSTNGVFLANPDLGAYQVSKDGAVKIKGITEPLYGSVACQNALRDLITTTPNRHRFEEAHAKVVSNSINAEGFLSPALASHPLTALVDKSDLASKLTMVARIIATQTAPKPGEATLAKRQVFFVGLGGFDNHDSVKTKHPALLTEVGHALSAFYLETEKLGVASQVTTFTASDFGRTLNSDGDGSDHGWGSMHFVLGGAVKGKEFYGVREAPVPANNGPHDVGRGRLLPSTSVDEFAEQLGLWFGANPAQISDALPNLSNFKSASRPTPKPHLDFLK